ncbi:MAG: wax ester/triacylglycerol synthase domain-containing protein, partial [Pseudomonadales bacterium]
MKQLTGLDASFLHAELPHTTMHIGPLLIYDMATAPGGFVRFKDILRVFEERLDRSPVFRRKLANVPMSLDQPYWVEDEHFDLEFHVRHIALPKPGDWRQMSIQCARLLTRPLDHSRPLWEAYVIKGLDNIEGLQPGCFALLLKIHHAAIDGATAAEIINSIHDLSATPNRSRKKADTWKPEAAPSNATLLWRAYLNNLKQPLRFTAVIRKGVPAWLRVREGEKHKQFRRLGENERTRFNAAVSAGRIYGAVNFSLADVRKVKNTVTGATVNDVVL